VSAIGEALLDELLEFVDREANASANPDGIEVAVTDELVEGGATDPEERRRPVRGDQQRPQFVRAGASGRRVAVVRRVANAVVRRARRTGSRQVEVHQRGAALRVALDRRANRHKGEVPTFGPIVRPSSVTESFIAWVRDPLVHR